MTDLEGRIFALINNTGALRASENLKLSNKIMKTVKSWGIETCPHGDPSETGSGQTQCYKHACGKCWKEL